MTGKFVDEITSSLMKTGPSPPASDLHHGLADLLDERTHIGRVDDLVVAE